MPLEFFMSFGQLIMQYSAIDFHIILIRDSLTTLHDSSFGLLDMTKSNVMTLLFITQAGVRTIH